MRVPWLILVVALTLPTAGAMFYFVAADPDSPAFRIGYTASKIIQFALPIAALAAFNRHRLLGIRLSTAGLGAGLVVGVIMLAAIIGLYFLYLGRGPVLQGVGDEVRAKLSGLGLHSPVGFIFLAVFLSLLHSFLEEYYWRWFVFAGLGERLPRIWAIGLSAAAFAAHHVVVLEVYFPGRFWTATVPFSFGVAAGGACWAWLYDRYRSLAGPWIAHVFADIAIMVVGFDLLFR